MKRTIRACRRVYLGETYRIPTETLVLVYICLGFPPVFIGVAIMYKGFYYDNIFITLCTQEYTWVQISNHALAFNRLPSAGRGRVSGCNALTTLISA